LEQPLVLEEGKKRERKKVERLEKQMFMPQEEKAFEIKEGKGRSLGDIPYSMIKIFSYHWSVTDKLIDSYYNYKGFFF